MRPQARSSLLALTAATTLLVACSDPAETSSIGDGAVTEPDTDANRPEDTASDVAETAAPDSRSGYEVSYVAGEDLAVGKSHLRLRVTDARDGKPAPGLASSIAISPRMVMSKMTHGNPVPIDAVTESATPGTYDATLFFTMASVDASGNPAGQWQLDVGVGTQPPVVLDVLVRRATSADTTHAMLKNGGDTFLSMGMAKPRNYVLFRDTLEAAPGGGYRLGLFVATVQEGMMVWPPVTTGLQLVDATGKVQLTIATVELAASLDGTTFGAMTCDAKARCTTTLAGLAPSVAAKVFVKLRINGKDYTTDGAPLNGETDPSKTNAFATFALTPGAP